MVLNRKRIFVVEDNLENRVVLRMTLGKVGAIVEFDQWGRSTLARLNAFAPVDLILLDLMLGFSASGYQIFDEIRADPAWQSVPIVAVSATNAADAIPRCMAQGFQGFIAKPIDLDQFPQQLARALAGEPIWYAGGVDIDNC